jgi:hypothetical protein
VIRAWRTLEDAKQLDTFQPMLDLGKVFTSKGATFERPINALCVAVGNRAGASIVLPRTFSSATSSQTA